MPFRRKQRWKSFVKKVKHIQQKQVAANHNVFVHSQNLTSAADRQTYTGIHSMMTINPLSSSSFDGFNDISSLFDRAVSLQDDEGPGFPYNKRTMSLVVSGWMCETSINNLATTTCYIDCYYWKAKEDVPSGFRGPTHVFEDSVGDIGINLPVTGGNTALDAGDYGVTPFQGTTWAKLIRIWKKTRVKLSPGGTVQLEQRSGKNHYRTWGKDEHIGMARGVTEGIMMIAYGVPTAANTIASAVNLQIVTNKNYTWRIVKNNIATGMHQDI